MMTGKSLKAEILGDEIWGAEIFTREIFVFFLMICYNSP